MPASVRYPDRAPPATTPTHSLKFSSDDEESSSKVIERDDADGSIIAATSIATVAIFYWLYLVFGAAAAKAGVPVPDFIPLVPGWPPTDADLAPALEDSAHFFYIQDLLNSFGSDVDVVAGEIQQQQQQQPPVVRLAVFNFAEAWVFAFLPVLLADKKRLPLPVVLFTWAGALGLTNAFLAPYLATREGLAVAFFDDATEGGDSHKGGKNTVVAVGVGAIASAVAVYASITCLSNSSLDDWENFAKLATEDRTYLAFCVDLVLFSVLQPFLLGRVWKQTVKGGNTDDDDDPSMPQIYNVPFVGLMAWLFGGSD